MIDVNVKGVLYGIGAVLPYMRKRKQGHIIDVSSVTGHIVRKTWAVYSGTKFAVRAITEALRKEEAGNNIRTTIICPGAVRTELVDTISNEEIKKASMSLCEFRSRLNPSPLRSFMPSHSRNIRPSMKSS